MLSDRARSRLLSSDKFIRLGALTSLSMVIKREAWRRPEILTGLRAILKNELDPDVLELLEDVLENSDPPHKLRSPANGDTRASNGPGLDEAAADFHTKSKRKIALLSYAHRDNNFHKDAITTMGDIMTQAVNIYLGSDDLFEIFYDAKSIKPGEDWQNRIDNVVSEASLLITILSPSFFSSRHCLYEVERFLKRQKQTGRNDLILPILFVDLEKANIENRFIKDELLKRHFFDWRNLRFEDIESKTVTQAIDNLATHIIDAVWPSSSSSLA